MYNSIQFFLRGQTVSSCFRPQMRCMKQTAECLPSVFQVIAAEGEMTSSRSLKQAADIMAETPSAMQLRYLQTLNTISAEKNSTIIFPIPVDFMKNFLNK